MGQPVVHFEVIGKDGDKLRSYYSELFGWEFGDTIGRRTTRSSSVMGTPTPMESESAAASGPPPRMMGPGQGS